MDEQESANLNRLEREERDAEALYRDEALEEALGALVEINGAAWLEDFSMSFNKKMRDRVIGNAEDDQEKADLALLARIETMIGRGEQAMADTIAAVRRRLAG